MRLHLLIVTALAICFVAPPDVVAQDEKASRILDSAIRTLGGESTIKSLKSIHFSAKGTENGAALGQDYSSDKEMVNAHEERLAVFLDGPRLSYEYKTDRGDGTTRWRRFTFTETQRIVADFINKVAYASAIKHPSIDRNQDARRIPHTLLLEVIANKSTLRHIGIRSFENKEYEVVSVTLANATIPIALYIDPKTKLLAKYEFSADFPGLGTTLVEYVYSDHHRVPKLGWVPSAHSIRVNGKTWRALKFDAFTADSNEADAMLGLPPELEGFVTPAGTVKEIAKGVYFVYGVGGFQPMFIEFKDFILAIEAPASHPSLDETPLETVGNVNSVTDEFIAKIKQTIPNKPIKYVAVTHAHSDHMGGLRSFIHEKSIALTTPGTKEFFERFARGLKIETFENKRTITDGDRVVELMNVGANPHTAENVVVYLPKEKIMFQGDLFYFNGDVSFPQKDRMTVMPFFANWLKKNDLTPLRIYGFHSTLFANMEHVEKVLNMAAEARAIQAGKK